MATQPPLADPEIAHAFALAGSPRSARVLEIPVSDGHYVDRTYGATFESADVLSQDYGEERYDVIFAFASLHHLNREGLQRTFKQIARALIRNGIFYMTLRRADENQGVLDHRAFYYTAQEVRDLSAGILEPISDNGADLNGGSWLTFAFKRA